MTTMAPAGEGGGGNGQGGGATEQAPSSTASTPAQQPQQPVPSQPHQHPPPSPLSGCYLLVVLPEPHTVQHKDLISNRLAKGFLSWDKDSCHVDLEKELQALVAQAPEGEEARNGERLIQYATENLVTEVLIYPQSNTLLQCIRNLLASFTKHRHIIHAGYTFSGNGSWILQDGTFSLADFLDAFSEHEVQRVLRAYENSVTVDIHCAGVGDWTTARLSKEACTRACRVRVNPDDVLTAGVAAITSFTNYIGQFLIPQTLDQLMEPSDVVGNIRFSHPTLYVFPGGQGDAALFGINGFNMLVDGGFARKACFWDFTRHLDRLDAVLVTRINNSNVGGMSSVLRKKKEMHVYPQIGHFFCNLVERRHSNSPDGDKDIDPLILNLIDIGQEMMVNLRHINLRPHPCYRDPEPINLYHKVGHGTLDMYVLSPSKDSREVREFMSKWNSSDSKLFAGSHRKDSNSLIFPIQNLISICALLVWQPANPEDTITRILFPGSTPQHKIFEGFERLKHLEFLKHPVCTAKSLSPSTSLVTLKDKSAIMKPKLGSIERETKRLAEIRKEKKDYSEIKAIKKESMADDSSAKISAGKPIAPPQSKAEIKAKTVENKKIESDIKESRKIEKELKETKKEIKKVERIERPETETKKTDAIKMETEKTAPSKESKTQKIETKKKDTKELSKPIVKSSKPDSAIKSISKPMEKKSKPSGEKKDSTKSSPTTPKKSVNGTATKSEISKTVAKSTIKITSKISSATPAKSAKDANNRMVVEQKNIELSSMASSTGSAIGAKVPSKSKSAERKPISRRTKPISPSKARLPISPAKSTRSTPTASVKSEKDAVIRKVKGGTTDSSAVSTPSGIESEPVIKLIDKNLTEKSEDMSLDSIESKVLADLKEEREVVEEIEAVLQKAERIEEARKEERFEGDDDITAEATDKKEEDMTEEDVTAEMDDIPKKISRKESQELTEEDEYLIVEKEEIYTEDSVQSGDAEQKHHLDEAESEKARINIEKEPQTEELEQEEKEFAEEKKDEIPEKNLVESQIGRETRKSMELPPEQKELLKEEMKQIIASATEAIQKTEEKDDSGKKDSEDITKEPSSLSPDKLDSSVKPDVDQKEIIHEKLEESQERISTLESGATTTAPTLPEDERIPLDDIKEDVDEKHVIEEVKEKDMPIKETQTVPESLPVISKPEVKVLDVRAPTHHGIPRDVVKTPDEVADLPVHEEVDPKFYRMDDVEKEKDAKVPALTPEQKESPLAQPATLPVVPATVPTVISQTTPPVKEQKDKGVFSFFGKVADKFEKGIDKLTKKARRDSEKDVEEKSSKSSSPKDPKPQEKIACENIDIEKVSPKVEKIEEKNEEKIEAFEHAKPQISDIKTAAIKETATFLQEEIKDSKSDLKTMSEDDVKDFKQEEKPKDETIKDIEEVEAFAEEASKKFKNAKDSLQDSLESLDEKVGEAVKQEIVSEDFVKDTLTGAAEKLVDIKSDVKEPEKVTFIIPSQEDLEGEQSDSDGIIRDVKEAVRDVAEVLVGTAGIEIEKDDKTKGKDVVEIVKKVAEVLKEDDFLSEKTLFTDTGEQKVIEELTPIESVKIPKKVSVTEEFLSHEKIGELFEKEEIQSSPIDYEKTDEFEIHEELCTKVVQEEQSLVPSPTKEVEADKKEAKRICEEIMKYDIIDEPSIQDAADTGKDVMDLGLEEVCVKKIAKREILDEHIEDDQIIEQSEISFEQKLSPGKAELVTVTPGSTPTSPKFATELEQSDLPGEYKDLFNKQASLENIVEEFIVSRKHKFNVQVLEYFVTVKHVPKQKIINIIQQIIIKYKIPRENVADDVQILRSHDISSEKRLEIENNITDSYVNKNRRISLAMIEEISTKMLISKRVVIEVVEEIIVRRKLSRESVFDISDESYITLLKDDLDKSLDTDAAKQEVSVEKDDEKSIAAPTALDVSEDEIVDGFVSISPTFASSLPQDRKKSREESKIVDDFEAVEQEYKVRDLSSLPISEKISELKDKEIEEVSEGVSDVIEADEKFVKETIEKDVKEHDIVEKDLKEKDLKKIETDSTQDLEISELSEIDAKEKYLDEEKEKPFDAKVSHDENVEDEIKSTTLQEKVEIQQIQEKISLEKSHADATGRADFKDDEDVSMPENIHKKSSVDETTLQESHDGTVKRMVVTASSEDGGHETEICPTGTITFTKTPTPEDSLKDDVRMTAEKDSVNLDKDSLRSVESTPEKDSIVSEKSDQDGEKGTPEDSLEKSPVVPKTFETTIDASAPEKIAIPSCLPTADMTKSPDSLHSGDASPAESVFSKSPTEKVLVLPTEEILVEETLSEETDIAAGKDHTEEIEEKHISTDHRKSLISSTADKETDNETAIKDAKTTDISPKEEKQKQSSDQEEIIKKVTSPKMSIDDVVQTDTASIICDDSKSPSVEKESEKKEIFLEISADAASDILSDKTQEKSKSSSIEKDIEKQKQSPEKLVKSEFLTDSVPESSLDEVRDQSKSPSIEKETSLEKLGMSKDLKHTEKITSDIRDQSKSPSVERDSEKKEPSPDKSEEREDAPSEIAIAEAGDKSKSPSIEKELEKKETSPEKSVTTEDSKQTRSESVSQEIHEKLKSPSIERDTEKKESSPEKQEEHKKSIDLVPEIVSDTVQEKSKSPSVEKELGKKEPSPEKLLKAEDSTSIVSEMESQELREESKPPSVEKDTENKETSEQVEEPIKSKDLASEIVSDGGQDKSKSPSVEKEIEKKEQTPDQLDQSEHLQDIVSEAVSDKSRAKSKSPSVEKQLATKESSPDKTITSEDVKDAASEKVSDEIINQSKSPSVERDIHKKDSLITESVEIDLNKRQDQSKSPSVEKETGKKEPSPEKSLPSEDVKETISHEIGDKSKSPSAEKEIHEKELSPEKILDVTNAEVSDDKTIVDEAREKSKSPSMEKEAIKKEPSPEKSVVSEDLKETASETISGEVRDKSKSPSVEKETYTKESSPEKILDLTMAEVSDEKTIVDTARDKSKSPSMEKETIKKEPSPEKSVASEDLKETASEIISDEARDKSKSPSVEKETYTKESSPEKIVDLTMAEVSDEKTIVDTARDKSKSPSMEKETMKKEPSPEKSVVSEDLKETASETISGEARDKSKSPSAEKEIDAKVLSPEKILDVTMAEVSDEKTIVHEAREKSKSPSMEKETIKKEPSPDKSVASEDLKESASETISGEVRDKSKSPSVEKDIYTKEPSPEKILDVTMAAVSDEKTIVDEARDKSKSPSMEKETTKKESSPEKSVASEDLKETASETISGEARDKSKSPSAEKEIHAKEPAPEKILNVSAAKETEGITITDEVRDKSKSPSMEKETIKKEPSPEKSVVSEDLKETASESISGEARDRSKSPSAEKEIDAKEPSPEKILNVSAAKETEGITITDEVRDKSKSPSMEKETIKKEPSPEKSVVSEDLKETASESISGEARDRSKSPSAEKEIDAKEPSPEKILNVSAAKETEGITITDEVRDKSKSPSMEKETEKRESSPEQETEKKESSPEKETEKTESSLEKETEKKDPSPEKETEKKEPSPEKETEKKEQSLEEETEKKETSPEKETEKKEPSPEKVIEKKEPSPEKEAERKETSPEKETEKKEPSPEKVIEKKEPSPEKETEKKETSPVKETEKKEPSPEKVIEKKESSPEKETEKKEPSPEKETEKKETSPEKVIEKKEPSPEKETEKKETSPVKETEKKEPSPEKVIEKKESSPEKETEKKEPSPEKETEKKETSPEKETEKEEMSPKKSVTTEDLKETTSQIIFGEVRDKSTSPSAEKQIDAKEPSPEKASDVTETKEPEGITIADEARDKSKSPSMEKETTKKERSPEKSVASEDLKETASEIISGEVRDKSKSPSAEKEMGEKESSLADILDTTDSKETEDKTIADEARDKSKSPSVEKETGKKDPPPEKSVKSDIISDEFRDKSKSPSAEKEVNEKEPTPEHILDAMVSIESEGKSIVDESGDKSKSPSVEKEIEKRESSLEKSVTSDDSKETPSEIISTEVRDKSKSPSAEKQIDAKEPSPEKVSDATKAEEAKDKMMTDEAQDKSKSPSIEKETEKKEPSPEKSVTSEDLMETTSAIISGEVQDTSKSPSAEEEMSEKEPSPVKIVDTTDSKETEDKTIAHGVGDKSKSPSVEKESGKGEPSPDKSVISEIISCGIQDKSKSPSVVKEVSEKEPSPEKIVEGTEPIISEDKTIADAARDESKSPSVEKETEKIEPSSEKFVASEDITQAMSEAVCDAIRDKSKSPSVDKDITEKEYSTEKLVESKDLEDVSDRLADSNQLQEAAPIDDLLAGEDKSTLLSGALETITKELSPDKLVASKDSKEIVSETVLNEIQDQSKSLNAKEIEKKVPSPDKLPDKNQDTGIKESSPDKLASKDQKESSSEKLSDEARDESKSPSIAKETTKKELSPEKSAKTEESKSPSEVFGDDFREKSKSPSVEKEIEKKEPSLDKLSQLEQLRSSEPQTESIEIQDKSKSPSIERDTEKKESSPEKQEEHKKSIDLVSEIVSDTVQEKSKSPSVEKELGKKEPSPEKLLKAEDSTSIVSEMESQEIREESKSPSVEKDAENKETSEKVDEPIKSKDLVSEIVSDGGQDKLKSPSAEKEIEKKEPSTDKLDQSEHLQDIVSEAVSDESRAKSKSPSVEKESATKESSPDKTITSEDVKDAASEKVSDEIRNQSKSPSVERDIHKKDSLITESVEIELNKRLDKSKSPSVEKETGKKEPSPEKSLPSEDVKETISHEIGDKSKSPSAEKEIHEKELSPEKILDVTKAEVSDDKTIVDEAREKSKSPSMEKESAKKEQSPEKSVTSEDLKEITSEIISGEVRDKSKSPSAEKDIGGKDQSPEKTVDTTASKESEDKIITHEAPETSKSLILEKETRKKELSPEGTAVTEKLKDTALVTVSDEARDKSKSPSAEKEIKKLEPSPEKLVVSTELENVDSKAVSDDALGKSDALKSQLDSVDSVLSGLSTDVKDLIRDVRSSKSPSPEKIDNIHTQFRDSHTDKPRASIISDKFDEDSIDRTKSPSIMSDKSDEKDPADRSKSPSVTEDRLDIGDQILQSKHLSELPSILGSIGKVDSKIEISETSGMLEQEKHVMDKSKSTSPVSEKSRAETSLHESIDERKASITSIGSHSDDKGKDRSRSHSLFETGDRTPLVRSRAASLYEDKLPEKLNIAESLGHTDNIFEENDELKLSQEAIDELQKDVLKRDSICESDLTLERRKIIEDHILNDYINQKKIITFDVVNKISEIYKIDRYLVIKIINELIAHMKLGQDVINFDEKDYEESAQKVLDDEEKLKDYINDEFIVKKKKINSKMVDEIANYKSVSRILVLLVIENIITSQNLIRESVVDTDLAETQDTVHKEKESDLHQIQSTTVKDKESTSRKGSVNDKNLRDTKEKSKSPEPDSTKTSHFDRPEPRIYEEITISENKRTEVETLLIDEYIVRGTKLTEPILEQIIIRTNLPKYIILEIIDEILIKKHLSREMIADKSIFHDDECDETQSKLDYGESGPETSERKSSGYSTPDTRHYEDKLDKRLPYTDYESPFHKAFMGGMTEIRTTHITTLSGKSTPDFGHREGTPDFTSETTSTTTTITSVPEKVEKVVSDISDEHGHAISKRQSKMDEQMQEFIKSSDKSLYQTHSGDNVVILKTTQITTYPEEGVETTTKSSSSQKEIVMRDDLESLSQIYDSSKRSTVIETSKTIISGTESDSSSLIDKLSSEKMSGPTITEKTVSVTTTSSGSIISSTANIEEKLISLESHTSDGSRVSSALSQGIRSTVDSGKSTPDIKQEDKIQTAFTDKDLMDHTVPEQLEQSALPLIRDLITDDRSYSGKSSPDVSLPKDIAYGGSTGKSTPDISMSPLIRDSSMMQSHFSGRSTPDKRTDNRSRTATPEGFRSGDVIRTIITTTRTMSDDGEIITTTKEVTEATNEKGETVVLTEKTDVQVDERLPGSLIGDPKSVDPQRAFSPSSDVIDKEIDPTSPRSDLSSGHSRAATHVWGSSDERHTYSDDEQSSPPVSYSPHHLESRLSTKEDIMKTSGDFSNAAMSSSFYGELPSESVHFSSFTKTTESHSEPDEFSFKKFTVEKEFSGAHSDKGSKKYVDEADLDFEKALTGFKDEKAAPGRSQETSVLEAGRFTQELSKSGQSKDSETSDSKKDPLAGWDSPLGLPSPKAPRKFNLRSPIQPCSSADLSPDSLNFDVINDWGEPMRLPSPAPAANEVSNKGSPGTPKKDKKQAKKVISENIKNKKRSESPSKNDRKTKDSKNKVQPVYVDLTYVSHHGNSFYTALDFFKKVRARYYVFSGTEPSREVYDALLEAKKTWEDKDLEVTMIPTYDTDTLGYWVADNEEALAAHHIDLSPSASRCTINLQDHETSCSAYRLEF